VSGDTVYLRGGPDIEALVRAAGLVVEHSPAPAAVIGGLAVTCRLATVHRATADVDLVTGEPEVAVGGTSAADSLVASGVARRRPGDPPNRVEVAGTRVEIIETAPLNPAQAADIEPDMARLFVLAHRWALETATQCTITVRGTDATAVVPVAIPSAIVAMKLHSIQDRHDLAKRASDAWDLYRLLDSNLTDPDFANSLREAPAGLVPLIEAGIDRLFRQGVTQTRRWIVTYGDPSWPAIATEEALDQIADAFLLTLRRA
jgi:hypothetical protein